MVYAEEVVLANRKSFGWYVQAIAVFVMSMALMAKVYSFASEGAWPNAGQRTVVAVEFLLVAWSIHGFCSTWLRVAVTVFFGVSFAVNLTRLLRGEHSCDCFGGLGVPILVVIFISAAISIASFFTVVRARNSRGSEQALACCRRNAVGVPAFLDAGPSPLNLGRRG